MVTVTIYPLFRGARTAPRRSHTRARRASRSPIPRSRRPCRLRAFRGWLVCRARARMDGEAGERFLGREAKQRAGHVHGEERRAERRRAGIVIGGEREPHT